MTPDTGWEPSCEYRVGKPTRAAHLGVTDDDYARMLNEQGGGCAICGAKPKTRRLHVDHDHASGAVRGLLCYACNRLLPAYAKLPRVDAAYRYLARHELASLGRLRWAEEDRGYDTPCWIWLRAIGVRGYGVIRFQGSLHYVHRLLYPGAIGSEVLHHRCEVKACVNPQHLEPLSHTDHVRLHFRAPVACKRGHPWTLENTYLRPDGSGRRQCIACIRLRSAGLAA